MTDDDLIFEDPPVAAGGVNSQLRIWLDKLRAHPEQWAKYPEPIWQHVASDIKGGRAGGAEKGEFHAVARRGDAPNKKAWLYVRYVGPLFDEGDA